MKPETQNDTKVKLKVKGMPVHKRKNLFGDVYITYKVKIPKHLTSAEKELFEQLKEQR